MAEIVNLRQARKRNRRDEKERSADENRRVHGRSAAEKTHTRLANELADKRLEGHRHERPDDSEPS
jgi:hypothetical protein